MFKRYTSLALTLFIGTLLASPPLGAEETARLDAMTVTANKMEEKARDVSISTTFFDEKAVEDLKMESIKDIAEHTPNFMIYNMGVSGINTPSMRGMLADPHSHNVSAGLYVDGVPFLDSMGEFEQDLIDIKRIEVLRGPQGTLYGKSSEAGVINIITKKPGNEFDGRINVSGGSDNKRKGSVSASGPLKKDRVYLGISGLYEEKDGWVEHLETGDTVDDTKHWTGRARLRLTPTDALDIMLTASHVQYDDDAPHMGLSPMGYEMFQLPVLPDRTVNSSYAGYNKSDSDAGSLNIAWQLTEDISLSSVTSYRTFHSDMNVDYDFAPPEYMHFINKNKHSNAAQEIRLNSSGAGTKWLLGLYGDRDENDSHCDVDSVIPGVASKIRNSLKGKSGSFFSHAMVPVGDKFELIGGLRYDYQKKTFESDAYKIDDTWTEVSPKIGAEYRLNTSLMLYSTVSKGYLSGGFNPYAEDDRFLSYDEEKLISYEAGAKCSLWDNRATFNIAAFYMDIDDLHVQQKMDSTRSYTTNAGAATGKGVEIEMAAYPVEGLTLQAGFGSTDVEFDEFSDAFGDYAGNKKPFAPEYTFNASARYRTRYGFYTGVSLTGCGTMYTDKENNNKRDPYQLFNAKIGYEAHHFDVYVYGDNIFDETYDSIYSDLHKSYSEPREIGLALTYRL